MPAQDRVAVGGAKECERCSRSWPLFHRTAVQCDPCLLGNTGDAVIYNTPPGAHQGKDSRLVGVG